MIGNDDETLDLGFSSILCTPAPSVGASVRRYLKGMRQVISRGRTRIVSKSRIRRVRGLGPNYFRQSLDIASRAHGRRLLGQIALDYQVPDPPTATAAAWRWSPRPAASGRVSPASAGLRLARLLRTRRA